LKDLHFGVEALGNAVVVGEAPHGDDFPLEKYSVTPTQAVLYFDSIGPHGEFKLPFRLRAKYPIRARTFASRVYEYYAPDVNGVATPVQIEVRK
jgi:hypothetical protein